MHLSMRVPWHDQAWNGHVCADPLGNASCVLLQNIGTKRDDDYELKHAGQPMGGLDSSRLPCLSERASFMSPFGYTVRKSHPYAWTDALKNLQDTALTVPPYSFEGIPYRWANWKALRDEVGLDRVANFNVEAEIAALAALGFEEPTWVSHGANQRAVFDAFFEPIAPGDSLVFVYLKHSPFQEGDNAGRLLVGAARVTSLAPPPLYAQSGPTAFPSSMWETIVGHSLRPDVQDGVLLPYQALLALMDAGKDVSAALAWAPEGRFTEFSYVTEHVSDDAAIESLESLRAAALAYPDLGLPDLTGSVEWIDAQLTRLWTLRGPVPGLASVFGALSIERPYTVARAFLADLAGGSDPWEALEVGFADPDRLPDAVRPAFTSTFRKVWTKLSADRKDAVKVLSSFDISTEQVQMLLGGETEVELSLDDLLANPYYVAVCTYGDNLHVPFATVDRALFPPEQVTWRSPASTISKLTDPDDEYRIQAMLVEVMESAAPAGDTLLPLSECLDRSNELPIARRPLMTEDLLRGINHHPDDLREDEDAWPLRSATLADARPAMKLTRYWNLEETIRARIDPMLQRATLGDLHNARDAIDAAINQPLGTDPVEEAARSEKALGLAELYRSPVSVLIGAAGTGKTTLLRALVSQVRGKVTLLAPTGKARVQLQTKVGREAKTLASFLVPSNRFDGTRYRVLGPKQRSSTSLLVIDEASMLTEEMLASTLDAFSSIDRLVLVGDPRQLPPIGAGRPFVDLVNFLRPDSFETSAKVGKSYVELTIPRRQAPQGADGVRWDLELASYFSDVERGPSSEEVWERLRAGEDLGTVRYEQWGSRDAATALRDVLARELKLPADAKDAEREFARSYGATLEDGYTNWKLGAGDRAEGWQILSPTRSRAFGTTEINRAIKREFRQADLRLATRRNRIIPSPIGPEQIVLGDKVMQNRNDRLKAWPADKGLNYVANGEIGVAIGTRNPKYRDRPLNVEYSSQPGAQYSYWPSTNDDQPIELAWAVTVHKAQGSEFGVTILMVPAHVTLTRELMYTALTRQQDRVVILHEGDLDQLWAMSYPWRSETARRLTDLFQPPTVELREVSGAMRRFDRNLIHMTANGTFVRSKNEVIIAEILDDLAPGIWEYEEPLTGSDGATKLPDFTITRSDGTKVYWEHLGMLNNPKYARDWAQKHAWYTANGILTPEEGEGTAGILLTTSDSSGVNVKAWRELAREVLGGGTAFPEAPKQPKKKRRS